MPQDPFNAIGTLKTNFETYNYCRLKALEESGHTRIDLLPFSIRILLEAALRQVNENDITKQDVINLAGWLPDGKRSAMPFKPGRVVMQDFTGVPAIVDLAAMRSAMSRLGGDPKLINPVIPVDLVIDHSVQVDFFATADALQRNSEIEFTRNRERYEFLHWSQKAFDNFRVVPPATGIVHQVNLEYLAKVVLTRTVEGELIAFPDTLVGTDSHTTMINGLGVVGWGVGGIEAEAALLGQAIDMLIPDVLGIKLKGELQEGTTPTDLTLTITQMLRQKGVVGKFVEFFGSGLHKLSLADRAMIANMSPESGATITFFPVDSETLNYLRLTGRGQEEVELVEAYCHEQGLFRTENTPDPQYSDVLELDMSTIAPSVSGPKRPHDRIDLSKVKSTFYTSLTAPKSERGFALDKSELQNEANFGSNGKAVSMRHGAVVIAAITSCTNTSNPSVMIAAGLLAKKAVEKGLKIHSYVKTSLAPGSRVVTEYLKAAGLLEPLGKLGFHIVGYGCTTCIGNSGPLPGEVVKAVTSKNLITSAVISGNRNFEGRIHPYSLANYLTSPPLVVAFALAGTVAIDLTSEPLGEGDDGQPIYLKDIWPTRQEIDQVLNESVTPEMFREKYRDVYSANPAWNKIKAGERFIYDWQDDSTYIQEPPFFIDLTTTPPKANDINGARVLALLGDSITTDHISPAGAIPADSPAGKFLAGCGVAAKDYNSYGSRRGNDQVMSRGTFANIRLKNQLLPGVEGGYTRHFPSGEQMSIFDAAMRYQQEEVPLIVLAGREYGSGSSRDWAAKGALLLGIKVVIAESFERIHRANLVGMGILPAQFMSGENAASLGLDGSESYDIHGLSDDLLPGALLTVTAAKGDGKRTQFSIKARLDTAIDVEYYRNNGILHTVLREKLTSRYEK